MARARGFTLIELLVALFVMAVLAGLAWQGVDSMLRAREATRAAMDATLRVSTALTQWEQDIAAIVPTEVAPGLQFDGRSTRLTRRVEGGVAVVAWTVADGAWWRWASESTTEAETLQQRWLASQQLQDGTPGQLRVLEGAADWQVYFYRGNGWSHAQSSGDIVSRVADHIAADRTREELPAGVRLVLTLAAGPLVRDTLVPPHPP